MTTKTRPLITEAERLYGLDDAAEVLGCSRRQVNNLVNDGRIEAVDMSRGGRPWWKIRASALQAYINDLPTNRQVRA